MSLLTLQNVSKSFGERVLFENVSFNIENNTKMGFIGANGVGKTTLFRAITGEEDFEGNIVKSADLRIGVMEQTPPSSESMTAYDYTVEVFSRFFEIEKDCSGKNKTHYKKQKHYANRYKFYIINAVIHNVKCFYVCNGINVKITGKNY